MDCFHPRFGYQAQFIDFKVNEGCRVLDIGSGSDPFPYATVLVERYIELTCHRNTAFRDKKKPVVVADIHRLPLAAGIFDYVYCSHVLEHVDDPIRACEEIMRVGKRGYIETPTLMRDVLFSWAKGMHRWHVTTIDKRLIFFEYSPRQLEGVRSTWWSEMFDPKVFHPAQRIMWDNMDIFVNMVEWEGGFDVDVYYMDGRTRRLVCNR
jgi:SAM-dependent methyltransferase